MKIILSGDSKERDNELVGLGALMAGIDLVAELKPDNELIKQWLRNFRDIYAVLTETQKCSRIRSQFPAED